ncbi:hypothetical protein BDY19DRAFT_965203 [Irpex rosettiformis]|uniref:Uncharacterized protein n=1 Tax=Irpex rosettiformis TaxID=378272 RepID=A0ACB8TUG6_9APHY|nr:hypothetical protein BDY19DRAFT_965203 [Irpex rosettiformis]
MRSWIERRALYLPVHCPRRSLRSQGHLRIYPRCLLHISKQQSEYTSWSRIRGAHLTDHTVYSAVYLLPLIGRSLCQARRSAMGQDNTTATPEPRPVYRTTEIVSHYHCRLYTHSMPELPSIESCPQVQFHVKPLVLYACSYSELSGKYSPLVHPERWMYSRPVHEVCEQERGGKRRSLQKVRFGICLFERRL